MCLSIEIYISRVFVRAWVCLRDFASTWIHYTVGMRACVCVCLRARGPSGTNDHSHFHRMSLITHNPYTAVVEIASRHNPTVSFPNKSFAKDRRLTFSEWGWFPWISWPCKQRPRLDSLLMATSINSHLITLYGRFIKQSENWLPLRSRHPIWTLINALDMQISTMVWLYIF